MSSPKRVEELKDHLEEIYGNIGVEIDYTNLAVLVIETLDEAIDYVTEAKP